MNQLMLLIIVVFAIGCVALRILPMLLAEAIATTRMVGEVLSSDSISLALIERGSDRAREAADWNRRPTAAERKLLQRGLRMAIQQTGSNSLLPHVALRARRIVAAFSHRTR